VEPGREKVVERGAAEPEERMRNVRREQRGQDGDEFAA
jgi:hypothetical protein